MPIFVDPKTGEQFENYEPDAAERATEFGFVTKEAYDAEQRSAGIGGAARVAGAELTRLGAVAVEGVEKALDIPGASTAREVAPESFSRESILEREARPGIAMAAQSAPAVAASLLLPGSGLAGLAATIGVDVASGAGQAAVDAELENRQITGTDILRNAGLNLAFSLPLYGLGEGARLALKGKAKNALETAADTARDTAGRRATAAEGQELAQAVADPAVQADLLDRVSSNAEDAVARAHDRIADLSPPVVARNPNAQREAVRAIADVTRTANPDLAQRLDAITKVSSKTRFKWLQSIRNELASAGDSDTLAAIDATLGREDLWGSGAVRGASDIDAVLSARPGPGAAPEELIDYAGKLRQVRGGEFAGMADEIEQLAERQIEIRTAATIGDVAPGAANDVVDYAAAMRTIDPNEAWRLTRDGADDGLRQLESTSVSDAMQRVDDVLREDVAMSVKREDFVKGAESWTPSQVAKQTSWGDTMRGRAMALAGELDTADARGFRIGGFRAEATDLIDRTVQRLADADPVTANHEWDNLKRSLDSLGKRLAASQNLDEASKVWGTKKVLELSDDMRKGLEDAELWGRNAALQKETNAAWVNIIDPYSRVTKKMAEFLGREFGVVGQAGIRRRFDPDMINSIMSRGYQKNLRADIDASIKGLDQMMQARQSQGLSHLDRLSKAREDLIRIRQGFDFADLLAVAKSKAKAPIGLDVVGRLASTATPGGLVGSVVGPVASRVSDALVGDMAMLKPGSKSMLSGAVRRHIGMSRGEQAAMLADPAFFERLPASLQKQVMAGSAANDRAIQLAQTAADAAQRDRELTARLMVNTAEAKRAAKLRRKPPTTDSPALKRAKERVAKRRTQSGHTVLGKRSTLDVDPGFRTIDVESMDRQLAELPVASTADLNSIQDDVAEELRAATNRKRRTMSDAEQGAVSGYAGADYIDIRRIQKGEPLTYRDGQPYEPERALEVAETAAGLETAAEKLTIPNPTQHGPLYRGLPATDDMLDELLTHDEFVTSAMTSSSFDPAIAQEFTSGGGAKRAVLFKINSLDRGAALMGGEREILLPKGEKFRITNRRRLENGTLLVDVEQVGKASDSDMRDLGALGAVAFNTRGKGSGGRNFTLGDIAKSPLGVGTGAAAALGTYAALKEPAMPDPESQTPLQRFSEGYDRPSDAFRAARKMVLDWQRNPGALVDMIDGHIGDVGQQSPKLAREMTQQAMRIAAYLQDNLPGQRNVSVVYPDGTPPSRAEVRQFALRFDAAVNPAGVLADGRAGRLERTQVDTLQALWPQEYDALRAGVLEELGKGKATPQTRQRMSLLFSFPSGVDPALGARTRAIVATARQAQDAAKKPAPSSPGMDRQRLPSTATMQPAGMAALSLGQQIQP